MAASISFPFDSAIVSIKSAPLQSLGTRDHHLTPFYSGSQPMELCLYLLITPVEMIHALDLGDPFCGQPGNYEAGARPQIGGHDRRPGERRPPGNDQPVPFNADIGS